MMSESIRLGFLFMLLIFGFGTSRTYAQVDTLVLTYQEYLGNILNYHPLARKADLKIQMAEAELLGAKGSFDPEITSDWSQKNFDDRLYYRQYQAKIKLPTRYGVHVVGGYENTEGDFLNPEGKTDQYGLWNLGVEVDVLQGLIVNERKTALDQAKVFQNLAKNEQQIMLNDLVYNASTAYMIWQQYTYNNNVLLENVTLATTYASNIKQSYLGGEKTVMDTLEAFILYQDALALLQKNEMALIKSRQRVENYLWFDQIPVLLQEMTQPENYKNRILPSPIYFDNTTLSNHPVILASINKLSYYEIEQRLKREKLKPKLKLKYNPLLATSNDGVAPNYSINDYKWGFNFSMPILWRKERADIQRGEIKMQGIELDIDNKRNELQNKIENSWAQQQLLQDQVSLLEQNVQNYRRLLEGENEKFNYGESSVFLLNKRQEKYIDGQLKLIEAYIKQQVELLNFLYYSNQIIK